MDLPGARRPDEEHELTLLDVDRNVAERDDLALVDLGDLLEADHETFKGTRHPTGIPDTGHVAAL